MRSEGAPKRSRAVLTVGLATLVLALLLCARPAAGSLPPGWAAFLWAGSRGLLVLGGLLVLRASPAVALAIAILLVAAGAYRAWRRSESRLARRIAAGAATREGLAGVVRERHPEWGEELIALLVQNHPDPRSLARILMRMEREKAG